MRPLESATEERQVHSGWVRKTDTVVQADFHAPDTSLGGYQGSTRIRHTVYGRISLNGWWRGNK